MNIFFRFTFCLMSQHSSILLLPHYNEQLNNTRCCEKKIALFDVLSGFSCLWLGYYTSLQKTCVVYWGRSPSNSLCVDDAGRTLLTQTWLNTETFYCQPGPNQNYRMTHLSSLEMCRVWIP